MLSLSIRNPTSESQKNAGCSLPIGSLRAMLSVFCDSIASSDAITKHKHPHQQASKKECRLQFTDRIALSGAIGLLEKDRLERYYRLKKSSHGNESLFVG